MDGGGDGRDHQQAHHHQVGAVVRSLFRLVTRLASVPRMPRGVVIVFGSEPRGGQAGCTHAAEMVGARLHGHDPEDAERAHHGPLHPGAATTTEDCHGARVGVAPLSCRVGPGRAGVPGGEGVP